MNATNSARAQPEPFAQFVQTRELDLELVRGLGSHEFRQFLHQHHHRVGELCRIVATAAELERPHSEVIARAGALHDIGKVFVPVAILERPGPLTGEERELVQKHTYWGSGILACNPDPIMQLSATVALQHHECWDGTGYPFGLRGAEICLEARIVTICDVYDALRAQRPYKKGYSHNQAMAAILNGDERLSPTMFDPEVVRCFIQVQFQCESAFNEMRVID